MSTTRRHPEQRENMVNYHIVQVIHHHEQKFILSRSSGTPPIPGLAAACFFLLMRHWGWYQSLPYSFLNEQSSAVFRIIFLMYWKDIYDPKGNFIFEYRYEQKNSLRSSPLSEENGLFAERALLGHGSSRRGESERERVSEPEGCPLGLSCRPHTSRSQ
jgi:hypothetical protein